MQNREGHGSAARGRGRRNHRWEMITESSFRCPKCKLVKFWIKDKRGRWSPRYRWPNGKVHKQQRRHVPRCSPKRALDTRRSGECRPLQG